MESGASQIPVGKVTGCDDFEEVSFTHPHHFGSRSGGYRVSSERRSIA
jgi:hypothetical protein